jgi:hypothetical protein
MIKKVRNEKGNITLLTLGLLGVTMIMFLVVLSFSKVFAIKEKASTASQQASIAATSVFYEVVDEAIEEYDTSIPGELNGVVDKTIEEKIKDKKEELMTYNPFLSSNEANIQAINDVLSDELTSNGPKKLILNDIILRHLQNSDERIKQSVADVISTNGGMVEGSTINLLDHNQVTVETYARYEALKYDELIPEDKRKLKQEAKGPEVDFIKYLVGWTDHTIEF